MIYLETRYDMETDFSKLDLWLIFAGMILVLYSLFELIPGVVSLNAMRKPDTEDNHES